MRGFPLLQLLIVAAVFAAAGWPVWSLTRPALADPPATLGRVRTVLNQSAAEPMEIAVSFAPAPLDFQVLCQDQTVLAGRGPERQFSARWKTVVPKEGIDLVVRAHWAAESGTAAGPAAARLRVGMPDALKVEKTFWTAPGEALAEVITVPGVPVDP